jgi:hypothetical protein
MHVGFLIEFQLKLKSQNEELFLQDEFCGTERHDHENLISENLLHLLEHKMDVNLNVLRDSFCDQVVLLV